MCAKSVKKNRSKQKANVMQYILTQEEYDALVPRFQYVEMRDGLTRRNEESDLLWAATAELGLTMGQVINAIEKVRARRQADLTKV